MKSQNFTDNLALLSGIFNLGSHKPGCRSFIIIIVLFFSDMMMNNSMSWQHPAANTCSEAAIHAELASQLVGFS